MHMLIKVETRYWYPITENMTNQQQFIKKNYLVILSKSYMTTSYGVMVVYSSECGKAWF